MKKWMNDETKAFAPHIDIALVRLLTEYDRNLRDVPIDLGECLGCFTSVCGGMRAQIDAPMLDEELMGLMAAQSLEHMNRARREAKAGQRTWNHLYTVLSWGVLESATIVLTGSNGGGFMKFSGGRPMVMRGREALMWGLGGLCVHVNAIRCLAADKDHQSQEIPTDIANIRGLPDIRQTFPKWLAELVDAGQPENLEPLSLVLPKTTVKLS